MDNYLGWARYIPVGENEVSLEVCDSDSEGAFKIYKLNDTQVNTELVSLCIELLSAADKCGHEPHFIVQPFMGIVKKHAAIIERLQLIR